MHQIFRDPIHGNIKLELPRDQVLLDLIDTPFFQRLRRIRQLGTSYLTYHGAEHSRFTHSLGVMHLMTRALEQLRRAVNDEEFQLARIAALLHDIGHGPFSHSFENLGKNFSILHHEERSLKIIEKDSEIYRVLVQHNIDIKELKNILIGKAKSPLLSELLKGHFDVDRADYLLRDSHATGVKYGVFDLERLLSSLSFFKKNSKTHLAIDKKGLHALEEFILARYFMYEQVYLHKTSLRSEFVFRAIFQRVSDLHKTAKINLRHPTLQKLFSGEELSNYEFWLLDDHLLTTAIASWAKEKDPILKDLCNRFLSRKLLKSVEAKSSAKAKKLYKRAYNLAKKTGYDPKYYVAILDTSLTPYPPYDLSGKQVPEIYILEDKNAIKMSESSDIISQFARRKFQNTKVCFPESIESKI